MGVVMMMRGWVNIIVAGLAMAWPQVCQADSMNVVINEVLYDPDGSDTGREFVELYNRSDADICLYYYEVATGNGAHSDKWTDEWRGTRADTIRAGGFFVIGEDLVSPAPDFTTALDLQNGPDAVRLVSPASQADVVGWGDHDFGEYYEGAPADLATAGASLGRDPDGRDTGDNSADLAVMPRPSPAGFNHPPLDLAVEKACLSRYADPGHATVQIIAQVANLGTSESGPGAMLRVACSGLGAASAIGTGIPAGARVRTAADLPNPGEGLHAAEVWVEWPADMRPHNDTLMTSVLIWPAPAVINEFMFKPGAGGCEWIEVYNRDGAGVDLSGWTLEDSGGKRRQIAQRGAGLAGGGYLVLAEDAAELAARYPGLPCPVIEVSGGWPTLNDADGSDGYADMIVIRDAFGTCVDSVAYRGVWCAPGTSVERIDPRERSSRAYNWSPHYGSGGGSPGTRNSVSVIVPEPGGWLSLSPMTFSPDGDGADDLLSVSVETQTAAFVRLKVFDIKGRPLKTLLDGDFVEERRLTFWDGSADDGRAAPIGIYVVLLEARPLGGGQALRDKQAVVLVRR
jgi:hypothetical protein